MARGDGSHGSGINPGLRLRCGYGLTNWLELGGTAGFTWAPGVIVPRTLIQRQPGELHTDVIAV